MANDSGNNVVGIDGLSDVQREGARLAAQGWRGVDIADHLGVAQETVSRWRRKPEYVAAIEWHLADMRAEVAGRMSDMVQTALDVVEGLMEHGYDPALRLRAAIALLQLAGVGRSMTATRSGRSGDAEVGETG